MHTKPNILLLFSDQHHAGAMQCAGHPDVKTPFLDQLAAKGVRYNRAYCQNGICLPSRASLISGQYCRSIGYLHNSDGEGAEPYVCPPQYVPFPEQLRRHGYRTAAVGKRHVPRCLDGGFEHRITSCGNTFTGEETDPSQYYYHQWLEESGNAEAVQQARAANAGRLWECSIWPLEEELQATSFVRRETCTQLREAAKSDQPFFLWSSFLMPHGPYDPARRFAELYDPASLHLPEGYDENPDHLPPLLRHWRKDTEMVYGMGPALDNPDLYREFLQCYYGCISQVDDAMDQIVRCLEEEGLLENTIIIYASDHGDFATHHGLVEKCSLGHNVYEDILRVPLIVSWPGQYRQGVVQNDLVELVDLYPTLLDMAGAPPPECPLPGHSLVPNLTDATPVDRSFAVSENWTQVTIVTDDAKLGAWQPVSREEADFRSFGDLVFEMNTDPGELNNLGGKPEAIELEKNLRTQLNDWLSRTPDTGYRDRWPLALRGFLEDYEYGKLQPPEKNPFSDSPFGRRRK